MVRPVSAAYAELTNIINTAKFHKEHCQVPDCNVSLWQLGMTAKRLVLHCWLSERAEVRRLIAETDWT